MFQHIKVPTVGEKIQVSEDGSMSVPDNPIIPFMEGDGIGVDITPVMRKVVDAAVHAVYEVIDARFRGWKFMPEKNRHEFMGRMCGSQMKP